MDDLTKRRHYCEPQKLRAFCAESAKQHEKASLRYLIFTSDEFETEGREGWGGDGVGCVWVGGGRMVV